MSDYIPAELIPNILARLPVADVLRCTSVCKSWYNLITSTSFILLHLNLSISNAQSHVLVRFHDCWTDSFHCKIHRDDQAFDEIQDFEHPWARDETIAIHGSSNGLFCCSSDNDDDEKLILWNPSLRKSLILPNSRDVYHRRGKIGFGFVPFTDIYKVVRVICTEKSDPTVVPPQVEIYESCNKSWRDVDAGGFSYVLDDLRYAILKGILYWIARNPYHIGGKFERLIASFDLTSEKFGDLMLPKCLQNKEDHSFRVSTMKESLYLIDNVDVDKIFSVFIMKEYGTAKSWEKLYNIPCSLDPLYFRENGEILSAEEFCRKWNLVSYDPKTNTLVEIEVGENGGDLFVADAYVESLFLIQDSNEINGEFQDR